MAYLSEEELDGQGGGPAPVAGAPTPAAGAPVDQTATAPAAPSGGRGTGYVNLEKFLTANRESGQGMANTIAGNVSSLGEKAKGEMSALEGQAYRSSAPDLASVNPGLYKQASEDSTNAAAQARAAGTAGGVGGLLQDQYGKQGGYTSGLRGFDTFLTRSAGADQLGGLEPKYGGLGSYLGLRTAEYRPSAANAPPPFKGAPSASPPGMVKPGLSASAPGRRTPVASGYDDDPNMRARRRMQ